MIYELIRGVNLADINAISHSNNAIKNLINSGAEAGTNITNSGSYRGQSVSLIPSLQSILEAAEELTFKAAESRSTDLSKKKVIDKVRQGNKIEEDVNEFLHQVDKTHKGNEIKNIAKMLSVAEFIDINDLKEFLLTNLKDVTDQFAVLVMAKNMLPKGASALRSMIDALINQYVDKDAARINAGINIHATAIKYEDKNLDDLQSLRNFYRGTILNYKSLSSAYKEILSKYGEKRVFKAITFLLQGLGVELQANSASLEKIRLRQILDDLNKLKLLNTLMDHISLLFSRVMPNKDKEQKSN